MAENGTLSALSAKQKQAISALLMAGTVRGAAQLAHMGERTLFRWIKQKEFKDALQLAGDEAFAATVRALSDAGPLAVLTLRNTMTQTGAKDSDRRGAADSLLKNLVRIRESGEIERRLAELEAAMQQGKSKR